MLDLDGALAQLGEHLLCKQGVVGSIPTGSTNDKPQGLARWNSRAIAAQSFKEEEKVCSLVGLVPECLPVLLTL